MSERGRSSAAGAIRAAVPTDVEAVAAVHCRSALAAYAGIFPAEAPKPTPLLLRRGWERLSTDPATTVLVAEAAEGIIGVVALTPDGAVPTGMLLTRLYVDPSWWGRGVGAALHDAALQVARERGVPGLNLWVLEANDRARRMYERRGWELVPGRYLPNDDPTVLDVLYQLDQQ